MLCFHVGAINISPKCVSPSELFPLSTSSFFFTASGKFIREIKNEMVHDKVILE